MRRTLALVLALAAVLWFAPASAAAMGPAIDPYRDHAHAESEVGALQADGEDLVEICHVPPGNPAAAHTIRVGAPAVDHHMSHHDDTLGPCEDEDSGADDGGNENPDDGGTDTPDSGNDGGSTPDAPAGPSPSAVAAFPAYLLWLLLIALAGGAAATAYVLRRRMRAR